MTARKREPVGTAVLVAVSIPIVVIDALLRALGRHRERKTWEHIVARYGETASEACHDDDRPWYLEDGK